MFSPVVDGSVKSGAGFPITGSKLVAMLPPRSATGLPREPGGTSVPSALDDLLVNRLHGQGPLEVLLDHAPVQVVEERIDVLGARAPEIDPVGVLVHVQRQDRRGVPERERVLRVTDRGGQTIEVVVVRE